MHKTFTQHIDLQLLGQPIGREINDADSGFLHLKARSAAVGVAYSFARAKNPPGRYFASLTKFRMTVRTLSPLHLWSAVARSCQ